MSSKKAKPKKVEKKNPVGRPTDYRPEYPEMLLEHMKKVHSFESFGGIVGAARETLYLWCREHEEFMHAKKIGRMYCQKNLENLGKQIMSGAIKGNVAAWIFWMKNCTDWRDDPDSPQEEIDEWEFITNE